MIKNMLGAITSHLGLTRKVLSGEERHQQETLMRKKAQKQSTPDRIKALDAAEEKRKRKAAKRLEIALRNSGKGEAS